jgi:hypothetical protein
MWRQLLADAGSIASLVSLALTGYVALSLRKIKNTYIFRIRAPEFIKALLNHASTLNDYGNDYDNSTQEIGDELARADVKLRSMEGRMRGESKAAVKQLRVLIEGYNDEPSREKFRLIYRGIQRVVEEIRESREDLSLE